MPKEKKTVRRAKKIIVPKRCAFCKENKEPWFSDVEMLNRYVTERGKLIGRARSGICATHQRHLSLAVKYARHIALMPFVGQS